jgi:FixJ family two-component response regulator
MSGPDQTVFVVDDDEAVQKSLRLLMKSVGLECEVYGSAKEFLESYDPERSGCLVLDIRMPGMSGVELQERLTSAGAALPIIFITGHGDVDLAVRTLHAGAVDFIQKPFKDQALLDRIHEALEKDVERREISARKDEVLKRFAQLTPREAQVMEMIVNGSANKVIAFDLEISERTVEIHRARVMEKTGAKSLAHLVQMAVTARE